MALVQLPCEVLLLIFHHLPTAKDALALAGTSVFMRRLFRQGNKLRILLPILGIPRGIPFDVDATQSVIVRPRAREWYVRTGCGYSFRFTLSYAHLPHNIFLNNTLHDLQSIRQRTTTAPEGNLRAALLEFLAQFRPDEWNVRRKNTRPHFPFGAAAELQEAIIIQEDNPRLQDDLASEDTIVALALNIFAICEEFCDVHIANTQLVTQWQRPDNDEILSKGKVDGYYGATARIEAHRIPTESVIPDQSQADSDSFQTMTYKLFQLMQRMLLNKPDQKNWSSLLYALCILRGSHPLFKCSPSRFPPVEVFTTQVNDILDNLCQQFFICSDGGQPLTSYLYLEASSPSDDSNDHESARIEHLDFLHEQWVFESEPYLQLSSEMVKIGGDCVWIEDLFDMAKKGSTISDVLSDIDCFASKVDCLIAP